MSSSTVLHSKTSKIYKNKKLNTANFGDFTHTDYQVFLHLISKIGGVDEFGKYLQPEQLQREHILTAKEFSKVFETDINNCYRMLYKACKKLMKTSIILEKIELNEIWEINVCSTAKYNKNKGCITIKFTDDIMLYIAQAREKFVLYNLKEISNFGSLYTTRLYESLQEFKETGWMSKSIEQLRELFAVGEKFKTYNNFKTKTFAHACQEINDNYDLDLRFEEKKQNRKVIAVTFFFKPTIVKKITNQQTGEVSNIYVKPKIQAVVKKRITKNKLKKPNISKISEEQLSFPHAKTEAKHIKTIISSFMSKLFKQ